MKRIIEIHAAEGGNDSKLLTADFARAYKRFFDKKGWKHRVVRERPADVGYHEIAIEVSADNLAGLDNESGGHRVQRVPPTEKRGRVHTSTITIAVLNTEIAQNELYLRRSDDDFKIEWFQSLGAGGQNANKHHNCCRIIHQPTGLKQEAKGRSRESNLRQAKTALVKILDGRLQQEQADELAGTRKAQVGSGMRGDKVRTYREQDDTVKDHRSNRSYSYSKLLKESAFDRLW